MHIESAIRRLCRFLFCLGALVVLIPDAIAQGAEGIRPELGKALLPIQDLLKAGQHKEALARIAEADASTGKTPYELFILDRLRGTAAAGAGEIDLAVRSFEAVLASGRLPAAEQATILEALVGTYYRAKNYPQTIATAQRYFQQGGSNPRIRSAVIQARYASGDFATAATELTADLDADERLTLDVLRLQRVTGALTDADDYAYLGQLALQAGLPAEARAVLEEGFAKGGLKQPADAWLHLGETYLAAGKKDWARAAFTKADGPEGLRDLARPWEILARP